MNGHPHRHGFSGCNCWRRLDDDSAEESRHHLSPCRRSRGHYGHYRGLMKNLPSEAAGEEGKTERIAFLEEEAKALTDCLQKINGELEKLKANRSSEHG